MRSAYQHFLKSPTGRQWRRIGAVRRAGVAVPLFSVYSKNSIGIGELPDIELLAGWANSVGIRLIQFLPLNDTGFNFRPYDSDSSFALDPLYLSLDRLDFAGGTVFRGDIRALRKQFPAGGPRVNTGVKQAKLELLWKMFLKKSPKGDAAFRAYARQQAAWLEPYARFRLAKEKFEKRAWWEWPEGWKRFEPASLPTLTPEDAQKIEFQKWLQWQLFCQFRRAKTACSEKKVRLMGDLPFLVARDSADVWANQSYFKLDRAAGAPPDLYFAEGQRWGMPPYDWRAVASAGYDYLISKLRYAENFYDLFRIDHFVGLFRLWTIPLERGEGCRPFFDPPDEREWEKHGRDILSAMTQNTRMLPCAEDLGVIPECSYRVLEEFCVPGMEVQRWTRDWGKSYDFKPPETYRKNAVAVLSTHDMPFFRNWWDFEAGTVDEVFFERKCEEKGISFDEVRPKLFEDPARVGRLRWKRDMNLENFFAVIGRRAETEPDLADLHRGSYGEKQKFWNFVRLVGEVEEQSSPRLVRAALESIQRSSAIFSVQFLPDWLSLPDSRDERAWEFRINFPGTMSDKNWSLVMPFSLERLKTHPANKTIRELNRLANRV